MRSSQEQRLEQKVQAVIDGPDLPAPMNLYRRVTQGVRIAAWRQREEARFRHTVLGWILCLVLALAGAAGVIAVTNLDRVLMHGISGGMGWFDYYVSSAMGVVSAYLSTYALITAFVLALGTLLIGLLPFGRSLKGH